MSDGNHKGALPGELAAALRATPGAWDQWSQQPSDLRQTYLRWVTGPRCGRGRRSRARRTADYAARGVLLRSVQPPRERSVRREILDAARGWLVVTLLVGSVELLMARVLTGHTPWADLRRVAGFSAAVAAGTVLRFAWRHRRAPVASGPVGPRP